MPDIAPHPPRPDARPPDHDAVEARTRAHFDVCRQRIDGFVRAHFGVRGTLSLHRAALGPDLLRAPLNVLLAPVHVLVALSALLVDRIGLARAAAWLRGRRILLDTDVGRVVEERIATQLLHLPPVREAPEAGGALADRMLSASTLEALAPGTLEADARVALARRMARAVQDYAGTRGAVAEATTALATLCTGALLFGVLTPGVVSMAPAVAGALSMEAAVERFPFGRTLGAVWYGAFPPVVSGGLFGATLLVLVLAGAVFAAFAGIVADPVQRRLGIHRRRLHRLVDAMEAEALGTLRGGFSAPEHYYARLFDIADAGASLLRLFRG